MFYEANSVNRILICLNCLQRFNIPKLLPCGESICERCLSKLTTASNRNILCPYCKIYHESNSMYDGDGGFPTEKLLFEILNLKPVKVYRGDMFAKTESVLTQSRVNLQNLKSILDNKIKIISANGSLIHEMLKNNNNRLHNKNDELTCTNSYYYEYFTKFYNTINRNIDFLNTFLSRCELNDSKMKIIFNLASFINLNVKVNQNFLNSILLDRKLLLLNNNEIEFRLYYDFGDVLNISRRLMTVDNEYKVINYKNNSYFNNDHAVKLKKEVKNIWLSIFQNNHLIIFLQIFNYFSSKTEIYARLTNTSGQMIKEVCINETLNDSLTLITLTNTNFYQFESNYFLIAIENLVCSLTELMMFSVVDLKMVKKIQIDYKPVFLSCSELHVFALSRQIPFIHQLNFDSSFLEEHKAYGQNINNKEPFYMSNKIVQISSKFNDELLYVCFGLCDNEIEDDADVNSIKIFSLSTKEMIRRIVIPLNDSLIHIDSLLRILVINKTKRVLSLFTEVLLNDIDVNGAELKEIDNFKLESLLDKHAKNNVELNLTYECSLKHISGNISTFCVANGYVLINDITNRIIYIM